MAHGGEEGGIAGGTAIGVGHGVFIERWHKKQRQRAG